jgi:C2 domain
MTRYQLSIYAEKLPNRGLFRKPNPVAEVVVSGGPRDGDVLGRTEVVPNTLEPDFVRCFFLETERSINMPLTIVIYNDRDDSVLADATFEATEVFSAPGHFQVHKCANGAKYVMIFQYYLLMYYFYVFSQPHTLYVLEFTRVLKRVSRARQWGNVRSSSAASTFAMWNRA